MRVNAISPGVIVAPPVGGNGAGAETARKAAVMMHGTPANGTGTPDAIAHAAVYLASGEARFVHGR